MAERKLEVKILGDSRSLERAFGRSARASDSFGKKIGRGAGKGLLMVGKGAAIAGAAVGVGLALALKAGVQGLGDMQKVMAQTDAALKSTKNAAKTSSAEIRQLAESIEAKTGIDADAIQTGQNLLLTFTKIRNEAGKNNDIFNQASKTAVDLSVAFGTDMKSASLQLGKALNDPVRGVTALQRSGISFTQAQKDQIKALVESGDILKAQKLILGEVNTQVEGSAEAYGKTFPGQVERAKRAFEGLTETLAGPFMGILSESLEGLLGVFNNPAVQAGIKSFAEGLARTLQQAVTWVRANWPQIKHVVLTVFNALQTYYRTIVIPVFRGVIGAIGAAVNFVRQNMPAIKRAAADVMAWLNANVVPTVQSISRNVQRLVEFMTRVWREHGNTIKAIIRPFYNAAKEIITSALIIIRESIEFWLAVIRGDWGKAFDSLKTMVRAAFRGATAVIRNVGGALVSAALDVGSRIIDGVINGITNGYSRLKAAIEQQLRNIISNLNPFSPVEHGGAIIADKITNGFITRMTKNRARMGKGLSDAVRQSVMDARGNLAGLTSTLAGMLGQVFGAAYRNAAGKSVSELQSAYDTMMRDREKARLEADKNEANSEVARLSAIADRSEEQEAELVAARQRASDAALALSDWQMQEDIRLAQEAVDQKQVEYERDIANLTASFNDGEISAQQFRDALTALIGGATGAELGYAFASEFGAQVKAVADQIAELVGFAPGAGGPGVTSPSAVRYEEQMEAWRKRKKVLEDALADARKDARKKDSESGTTVSVKERDRINKAQKALNAHNKKRPKRLADGGILRSAVLAGEAGPEAVLPLSSGRAQRMLADAMDGADRLRGASGGNTIIHVTVNGNEFSAHEFARKIAPELRRQVALTRSV